MIAETKLVGALAHVCMYLCVCVCIYVCNVCMCVGMYVCPNNVVSLTSILHLTEVLYCLFTIRWQYASTTTLSLFYKVNFNLVHPVSLQLSCYTPHTFLFIPDVCIPYIGNYFISVNVALLICHYKFSSVNLALLRVI